MQSTTASSFSGQAPAQSCATFYPTGRPSNEFSIQSLVYQPISQVSSRSEPRQNERNQIKLASQPSTSNFQPSISGSEMSCNDNKVSSQFHVMSQAQPFVPSQSVLGKQCGASAPVSIGCVPFTVGSSLPQQSSPSKTNPF